MQLGLSKRRKSKIKIHPGGFSFLYYEISHDSNLFLGSVPFYTVPALRKPMRTSIYDSPGSAVIPSLRLTSSLGHPIKNLLKFSREVQLQGMGAVLRTGSLGATINRSHMLPPPALPAPNPLTQGKKIKFESGKSFSNKPLAE